MRKIGAILVVLLYLLPVVGVTVSVHTCDGQITSSSINPFDLGQRCACGSKKMEKGCCQNETTSYSLDEDQQKAQFVFSGYASIVNLSATFSPVLACECIAPLLSNEFDYSTHPPDNLKHPIYLRYRVFQI